MSNYLTRHQLIQRFPVPTSRPGLRNWIKRQGFPAPRYANQNTPLWLIEDVQAWFGSRPTHHLNAKAAG